MLSAPSYSPPVCRAGQTKTTLQLGSEGHSSTQWATYLEHSWIKSRIRSTLSESQRKGWRTIIDLGSDECEGNCQNWCDKAFGLQSQCLAGGVEALHGIAFHQPLPPGAMSPLLTPKQGDIEALTCMWTSSMSKNFKALYKDIIILLSSNDREQCLINP